MSELVKMPSGKEYRLEQPTLAWRLFNLPMPETLASFLAAKDEKAELSVERLVEFARHVRKLMPIVFVEPHWSEMPGEGLITAADVSDDDLFYILRWASLGVGAEVSDPGTFRGQSMIVGSSGGPVEVSPIGPAPQQ